MNRLKKVGFDICMCDLLRNLVREARSDFSSGPRTHQSSGERCYPGVAGISTAIAIQQRRRESWHVGKRVDPFFFLKKNTVRQREMYFYLNVILLFVARKRVA